MHQYVFHNNHSCPPIPCAFLPRAAPYTDMGVYQWIYFKLPVLQLAELTEEVSLVTVSPVNALSTSRLSNLTMSRGIQAPMFSKIRDLFAIRYLHHSKFQIAAQ